MTKLSPAEEEGLCGNDKLLSLKDMRVARTLLFHEILSALLSDDRSMNKVRAHPIGICCPDSEMD